jgi:hypothetical protein
MITPLVSRTLQATGLLPLYEAHKRGESIGRESIPVNVDLMALGALADAIRKEDVGDNVYVFANARANHDAVVAPASMHGLELMREVAILRITAPKAARVRVDWGACSLEVAQVTLGFGANELVGPIANRRGLPIAEDAQKKVKGQGMVSLQTLQMREIERVLKCAGKTPVFTADVLADAEREEATVHG